MDEILTLGEVLTLEEMKTRYAPDWVLIVELEVAPSLEILSGRVVFRSPSRDEVYRKAIELRPSYFACRHLGEWPSDMEFILSPWFLDPEPG